MNHPSQETKHTHTHTHYTHTHTTQRWIRATVKIRRKLCLQTLCCRSRNGSSMSSPPSWTTHQISMCPFILSSLLGNQLIPLGTNTASSIAEATRIASGGMRERGNEGMGERGSGNETHRQSFSMMVSFSMSLANSGGLCCVSYHPVQPSASCQCVCVCVCVCVCGERERERPTCQRVPGRRREKR